MEGLDIFLFIMMLSAVCQLIAITSKLFGNQINLVDFLILNSICLSFVGLLCYFFFGIPLDEGTIQPHEIRWYEERFILSIGLFGVGLLFPVLKLLRLIK